MCLKAKGRSSMAAGCCSIRKWVVVTFQAHAYLYKWQAKHTYNIRLEVPKLPQLLL
jgi:hypothetical protein